MKFLTNVFRFLVSIALLKQTSALEATWTPSDKDDDGPLPLSMNQRQQLVQLDQTIQSSSDPQGTLQKVAAANEMTPDQLARMLERNRRDLQQGGGSSTMQYSSNNLVGKISSSIVAVMSQTARNHPIALAVSIIFLVIVGYMRYMIPRTGLVLSTSSESFLSRGPTTMFTPPPSSQLMRDLLSERSPKVDDWSMHETKTGWSKASGTPFKISACSESILDSLDVEEKEDAEEDDALQQATQQILSSFGMWTEFVQEPYTKFVGARGNDVVLVVKGMGNWKRYGLQGFRVIKRSKTHTMQELVLATKPGGHFDGQLHLSIGMEKDHPVVRARLLFGKRRLSKASSLRVLDNMVDSLGSSLQTRIRQSIARRAQSNRFQDKASESAKERRHTRHLKEKATEEMSAERRRRWQRQNSNAGSYRPSGDRMRSPNNAVY